MKPTPYLFRLGERLQHGLATLPPERREVHRQFLLSHQNRDGGFRGRAMLAASVAHPEEYLADGLPGEDDSDLYYTAFAVRALAAIGGFDTTCAHNVAGYLQKVGRRESSVIDVVSWLYCSLMVQLESGQDLLAGAASDWPVKLAATFEEFRTADGGYAKTREGASGSTYHSFLVALCYELIGQQLPRPETLIDFVHQRSRDDGGFVEIAPMKRSGTNPTAAAVAILQMFDAVSAEVRENVGDFLQEVRSSEGGFLANSRIPFADGLSTFTGYLTCLDLQLTEIIEPRKIVRFLKELEFPTGGFRAAAWDNAPDVEYTFYGLGLQALIQQA